jgi:hypothetical protein
MYFFSVLSSKIIFGLVKKTLLKNNLLGIQIAFGFAFLSEQKLSKSHVLYNFAFSKYIWE